MVAFLSSAQQDVSVGLLCLPLFIFICRRVYSVYFGPLSKFPGPKLAAATLWYEFYYDVILKGRYTFKIKELHEKHGVFQSHLHSYGDPAKGFQVPSFASVQASSISTTQTTMKSFTRNTSRATNRSSMSTNLTSQALALGR
jgi:hypothetical protein